MLVNWIDDPVDSWVSSDGLVRRIDQDNFEVLVSRILVNPVRVQNSQVACTTADTLFSSSPQGSLVFQVGDTLVGWLTVSSSLWCRLLSATSSDPDTVDDISLLGLVTQSSCLVRSRRSGCPLDNIVLSVLPASHTEQESHNIRLLLSLQFL